MGLYAYTWHTHRAIASFLFDSDPVETLQMVLQTIELLVSPNPVVIHELPLVLVSRETPSCRTKSATLDERRDSRQKVPPTSPKAPSCMTALQYSISDTHIHVANIVDHPVAMASGNSTAALN